MKQSFSILVFVILTISAAAQSEIFTTKAGAIDGYDAVSYFTESKPVTGMKEYAFIWKGETWLFSSTTNMEAFKANPDKYAPQFGGYCAYGVADGHKAKIDPQAWTIIEGKLYLNYNKEVQLLWNKDQQNFIKKATKNWPEIKKDKF